MTGWSIYCVTIETYYYSVLLYYYLLHVKYNWYCGDIDYYSLLFIDQWLTDTIPIVTCCYDDDWCCYSVMMMTIIGTVFSVILCDTFDISVVTLSTWPTDCCWYSDWLTPLLCWLMMFSGIRYESWYHCAVLLYYWNLYLVYIRWWWWRHSIRYWWLMEAILFVCWRYWCCWHQWNGIVNEMRNVNGINVSVGVM
jgi:hypothetical protein